VFWVVVECVVVVVGVWVWGGVLVG